MERLAIKEKDKIKQLLDLKSNIKYKTHIETEDINERLDTEKSRVFIEDSLNDRGERKGFPKVGKIIVGIKFWHYQKHIGIITGVTGKEFEYTDLTLSNSNKPIALEWKEEIKEEQRELINKELDLAIGILKKIIEELKEKEKKWKKNLNLVG